MTKMLRCASHISNQVDYTRLGQLCTRLTVKHIYTLCMYVCYKIS